MWEKLDSNIVGSDDPNGKHSAVQILRFILAGLVRHRTPIDPGGWRFRRLDVRFSSGHGYLAFCGGNSVLFMLDKHLAAFIDMLKKHRKDAGDYGLVMVHLPDRWKDSHLWQFHGFYSLEVILLAYVDRVEAPGDVAVLTPAERDALIAGYEAHMTSVARASPTAPDGAPQTFEE